MKQKLFTLLTLLVLCVTGASAQTTQLFTTDFTSSDWSGVTFTQGDTTTPDVHNGITFYSKNSKKAFSLSASGLTFPDNNIASSNYFFAIPLTNIKGKITVTITHASAESKVYVKYDFKDGDTEYSASSISTSNAPGDDSVGDTSFSFDVTSTTGKGVLYIGRKSSDDQNKTIKGITITTPEVVTASFGAGKSMISFSNASKALDLTTAKLPDGLAAYKVTAANATSVTLTPVDAVVASNTGLILTGTAGKDYDILVKAAGDATDISGTNKLVATDGTSTVENAAVLSGGEFHPLNSGIIAAGKAYLPYAKIDGGNPFGGGAHALEIVFGNETTAIKAVEAKKVENGVFYNLAGQQVAQPTKGLYIVNGRKVIVK